MTTTQAGPRKDSRKRTFRKCANSAGLPFPNFGLGSTELPTICRCVCSFGDENGPLKAKLEDTGLFNQIHPTLKPKPRFSFSVSHQVDMLTLFINGSFGTSSMTHRGPSFLSDVPFEKQAYYKKLQERQKQHAEVGMAVNGYLNGEEEEKLLLLAEEVIFLTFGVGCLSLHTHSAENLSFETVWKKLVGRNPEFPFVYAVYHYFRSKNWIPKSGLHYGADYILYRVGPEFDHAAYIVHIIGLPSRPKPSWTEIYSWQRVAGGAGKKSLLCEVIPPKNFCPELTTPKSIFGIQVKEAVIERWCHSAK